MEAIVTNWQGISRPPGESVLYRASSDARTDATPPPGDAVTQPVDNPCFRRSDPIELCHHLLVTIGLLVTELKLRNCIQEPV